MRSSSVRHPILQTAFLPYGIPRESVVIYNTHPCVGKWKRTIKSLCPGRWFLFPLCEMRGHCYGIQKRGSRTVLVSMSLGVCCKSIMMVMKSWSLLGQALQSERLLYLIKNSEEWASHGRSVDHDVLKAKNRYPLNVSIALLSLLLLILFNVASRRRLVTRMKSFALCERR